MNVSGGETVNVEELAWLPLAPGVGIKPLRLHEESGAFTVMIHAAPGAVLPRHRHLEESHIYIIQGKGTHPQTGRFEPGNYVYERKGAIHDELRFEEETLLFMVNAGPSAFINPDDSVAFLMDVAMLKQLREQSRS
jgi:quercetin dioxygenase-like cupin family protein